MECIGIIPNIYRDIEFEFTKEIVDWLLQHGKRPMLTQTIAEAIGRQELGVAVKDIYETSDFLLVFGGDGTILRVAKYAAKANKPILGVNFGSLGYLTDVERGDCHMALEKVFSGAYTMEKRMMLKATTFSTDTENDELIALNDVCVTRGFFGNVISLELYINHQYIDLYKADGIIVSTPTGSTAYNLSAGGPILKPDAKMIAITPICPHMLHTRSFVISAEDVIGLKVVNKKSTDVILSLDGQNIIPVKDQDMIHIKTSEYDTTIIRTNQLGFYDTLRQKMVGNRKGETP